MNTLKRYLRPAAFFLLSTLTMAAASARPFLMFASDWDPNAVQVVYQNFDRDDFISQSMVENWGSSGSKALPHVFSLPANLRATNNWVSKGCSMHGRPEVVIYDPEKWEHTPPEEQANLRGSIASAAQAVRNGGCFSFGVAPGGNLVGDISGRCKREPTRLLDEIDWKKVDIFVVQTQALVTESCGGARNVPEFARYMEKVVRKVRSANPSIKVVSSMSFAHTSPETMKAAVLLTQNLVDGYYLAYPKVEKCTHCTPENLRSVIQTAKGRR